MGRRRRYSVPRRQSTFLLNVTSMTDMFTIMLVFLLQNYTTSEVAIEPAPNMTLPSSNTSAGLVEGARVTLSKTELILDKRSIASLKDSQFQANDVDQKDPNFIPELFNELSKLAQDKEKEHLKEGRLLLQADQDLPYDTLRKVLYTASMAGFPQLKMVTMVGN